MNQQQSQRIRAYVKNHLTSAEPWVADGRADNLRHRLALWDALVSDGIGPSDAHGLTVRWWLSYGSGVDSGRGPYSRLLRKLAGTEEWRFIAARFAAELDIDVPSAWILGLEEQHRIQENSST